MFERVRLPAALLVLCGLLVLTLLLGQQSRDQALETQRQLWREQQQQSARLDLQQLLQQTGRWLELAAAQPRLRDLIRSGAQTALVQELREQGAVFGVQSVLLHDRSSNTLYPSDAPARAGETYGIGDYLLQQYAENPSNRQALKLRDKPVLMLSRPVKSDTQTQAVLMATFPLDERLLELLKSRTGMSWALIYPDQPAPDGDWLAIDWPDGSVAGVQLAIATPAPASAGNTVLWLLLLLAVITTALGLLWWRQASAGGGADWSTFQTALREALGGKSDALKQLARGNSMLAKNNAPLRDSAELLQRWQQQFSEQLRTLDSQNEQLRQQLAQLNAQTARVSQERDAAVSAPRTRSEFLSRMGEEITTPMNSMMSMLNLLGEYPMASEPKEFLAIAQRAARTLTDNLNNILDFTKLDAGLLKLQPASVSINKLVSSLASEYAHHAASKKLKLTYSVHPDVPEPVMADDVRIRQILINLVSNAIRFTAEGEVGMYVDVVESAGKRKLRFTVSDTGMGIPRDAQAGLFDSLDSRSKLTNASFAGRLRLIVCKQLAELMGGEIGVSSEQGKGSRFWFTAAMQ